MVTQFPGVLLPFDFMDELREIWASGNVRPDAFLLVAKDLEGNVAAMEGGSLEEQADAVEVNAVLAALSSRSLGVPQQARAGAEAAMQAAAAGDFGLSSQEIHRIAERLPPDHTAVIVLFESVWERRFREVLRKYDGELLSQRFASPEALVRAAAEIGLPSGRH